jgi:hypothetical protein
MHSISQAVTLAIVSALLGSLKNWLAIAEQLDPTQGYVDLVMA